MCSEFSDYFLFTHATIVGPNIVSFFYFYYGFAIFISLTAIYLSSTLVWGARLKHCIKVFEEKPLENSPPPVTTFSHKVALKSKLC